MQSFKNVRQIFDDNSIFELSILTSLGDREEQQDSFGYELKNREGIIIICDGMGGLESGKLASRTAVESLLEDYRRFAESDFEPIQFLQYAVRDANGKVCLLKNENGEPLKTGSTATSLFIREGLLYWCSVGDSRAYLLRDGEFVQFTLDHNYKTVLQEQKNAGIIDEIKYRQESEKGEALISFLGVGKLRLIDYNDEPLHLKRGDKIIATSDGLYKLLGDDEIFRIIDNFSNIEDALRALETKAQRFSTRNAILRDNTTVALIKIK